MYKVWFDGEKLQVVEEKSEMAPIDVIVVNDLSKIKIVNNKVEFKTLDDYKQDRLFQLKQYVTNLLSQTDWVVIKLQSMREEGWSDDEIQVEMQKYQSILEQRKRIREWNLQMKQAIQNAQTIEELEAIRIEFEG